jgi:hypothetical protein
MRPQVQGIFLVEDRGPGQVLAQAFVQVLQSLTVRRQDLVRIPLQLLGAVLGQLGHRGLGVEYQ